MKTKIFERIGNYLKGRNNQDIFLSEKFNKFFMLEDYLFCGKMIDQGYKATYSEKNQLNKAILTKLENSEYQYEDIKQFHFLTEQTRMEGLIRLVPVFIDYNPHTRYENSVNYSITTKLLSQDKKLEKEDFLIQEMKCNKLMVLNTTKDYIKYYKKYYKSGLNSVGDYYGCYDPAEVNEKKIKLEKLIYLNILMIKNGLYNSEDINQIKNLFEDLNNYIEKKTEPTFQTGSYIRVGKAAINMFVKTLIFSNNDNEKENVEYLLGKTKSSYINNKLLVINEDYERENLPLKAKEKIENIEKIAHKINTEETIQFIESRIPIILNKYYSIDKNYRTILKNIEGFNAEELMQQSLDNIETMLIAKQQDNNYDLLSELSVENRKLKKTSI